RFFASKLCFRPVADIASRIHATRMTGKKSVLVLALSLTAFALVVTLPIWGMGPAVFFDSNRTIVARRPSPDGKRIAQIERLVVGGVPSIVVTVRWSWMPNWYLAG